MFWCWLLMLVIVPQVAMAASIHTKNSNGEISDIRWLMHSDDGNNRLRLVIDTTAPVTVSGNLENGAIPQLVFTLNGAAAKKAVTTLKLDGDIAGQASIIKVDAEKSRVVINLAAKIDASDYNVFTLRPDPAHKRPFRVVVDIRKPQPKMEYHFTPGLKNKVIVIDPGHGGSDPGAIGPDGIKEKTVTLAVAQKLKALLEHAGAKVVMTRTTDVDVYAPNDSAVEELSARAQVANKIKADIFLCIHANSFTKPTVGGTATYYYEKTGYDALLAKSIQSELTKADGLYDRGVYSARFYVLNHTIMPAILTELAFISNPEEEKMLNNPADQEKMAQGIANGVEDFFQQAARMGGN
jgi:N-acetylmuramoyl-L-alanine amidase